VFKTVITCKIKHLQNICRNVLVFYFTCNHALRVRIYDWDTEHRNATCPINSVMRRSRLYVKKYVQANLMTFNSLLLMNKSRGFLDDGIHYRWFFEFHASLNHRRVMCRMNSSPLVHNEHKFRFILYLRRVNWVSRSAHAHEATLRKVPHRLFLLFCCSATWQVYDTLFHLILSSAFLLIVSCLLLIDTSFVTLVNGWGGEVPLSEKS